MKIKIIPIIHLKQNQVNIFCQVFQCLQYQHLNPWKKKHVYRGKDCLKKFCESLRKHAMKIINFEKKKMKLLTTKQQKNDKICYISKEKFEDK